MEKHRPVIRVTRKAVEEGMSAGTIRSLLLHDLNLDEYDEIEGVAVMEPNPSGSGLVTFQYMGTKYTLPRYCVKLISRYEIE